MKVRDSLQKTPRKRAHGAAVAWFALLVLLLVAGWGAASSVARGEPNPTPPADAGDAPDVQPTPETMPSFDDPDSEDIGDGNHYVAEIVDSTYTVGPAEFFALDLPAESGRRSRDPSVGDGQRHGQEGRHHRPSVPFLGLPAVVEEARRRKGRPVLVVQEVPEHFHRSQPQEDRPVRAPSRQRVFHADGEAPSHAAPDHLPAHRGRIRGGVQTGRLGHHRRSGDAQSQHRGRNAAPPAAALRPGSELASRS